MLELWPLGQRWCLRRILALAAIISVRDAGFSWETDPPSWRLSMALQKREGDREYVAQLKLEGEDANLAVRRARRRALGMSVGPDDVTPEDVPSPRYKPPRTRGRA